MMAMNSNELTDKQSADEGSAATTKHAERDQSESRGKKVDLFAAARNAQMRDESSCSMRGSGTVKLIAPAKVNLFLSIGDIRPDGYHDALSILHALNLHDVLYMRLSSGGESEEGPTVVVRTSFCEGIEPFDLPSEKNIAYRAVVELAKRLGRAERETIEIHIEKHIPAQAGLGGGSSDAAAALLGAARLWGISPDNPALEEVALTLGSDVAFFLYGGCARFGGTGDLFEQKLSPIKDNVVLIKPADGVSTAEAYRAFDKQPQVLDEAVIEVAKSATQASEVPLRNNLAEAAECLLPVLEEVHAWACAQEGAQQVLLCGSGSSTFVVCESFDAACRVSLAARRQGWWARATTFGSLRAAVLSA